MVRFCFVWGFFLAFLKLGKEQVFKNEIIWCHSGAVVSVLQQEGCGCEVCVVSMFSMATSKDMHGGRLVKHSKLIF